MWYRRKRTRVAPKARNKEEKCSTAWCRNRKAAKKTYYRSPKGHVVVYKGFLNQCWKCHARQLKERHPATYVLNAIRGRAKQRKLPFTITLAEFKEWCAKTKYLELRGRNPDSATVDRKDHDKGYHIWNIQVKSFAENSTAGHVVPGRDCKQNEPKPDTFDYDFNSPVAELEPANAAIDGDPF